MSLADLNVKGRDVVLFTAYVVSGVFFVSRMQTSIERQGDTLNTLAIKVEELKADSKDNNKDNRLNYQSLQNQVNANTQQILLLKQEVERIKK